MKLKVLGIVTLCCMACSVFAESSSNNDENMPPPAFQKVAVETMDEMISLIREKHYSKDVANVDWDKVRAQYYPRVTRARNIEELTDVLTHVIGKVSHSHVSIFPPTDSYAIACLEALAEGKTPPVKPEEDEFTPPEVSYPKAVPGDVGLRVDRTDEGNLRVIYVKKGSPADKKGIKVGDRIENMVSETPKPELPPNLFSPMLVSMQPKLPWLAAGQLLTEGPVGTRVRLRVSVDSEKSKIVTLTRAPNGLEWFRLGVMDDNGGTYYSEMGDDKIGFITFSPCMPSQIRQTRADIRHFQKEGMKALILDFRANPGGLGVMTQGVCGLLVDTKTVSMHEITRFRRTPAMIYPQPNPFMGPVAVLINGASASSSEIFAATIKDIGRGAIFGSRTAGACLGSNFLELKSGYRLQTVLSNLERLNGQPLEKAGVSPDVDVVVRDEDVKAGKDPVRESATRYLKNCIQRAEKVAAK